MASRHALAARIDVERFARAVREGLTPRQLAERFGLGRQMARKLAERVRRTDRAQMSTDPLAVSTAFSPMPLAPRRQRVTMERS